MGVLDHIDSMESAEDISGGQGLERINSVRHSYKQNRHRLFFFDSFHVDVCVLFFVVVNED